jgi:hypothetical protein
MGFPNWFPSLSRFLCAIETCLLGSLGERLLPLGSMCPMAPGRGSPPSGPEMLSRRQGGENSTLQALNKPPEMLQDGSDREMRHQSFQEASLLIRPAMTQWICIQRLTPKNKRGLLYIPFRAGCRNGEYSLSHTCSHSLSLAILILGEVTLLWSHPRCYILFLKIIFFSLFHGYNHYLSS